MPAPAPFEFRCTRCGEVHRGAPSLALHQPVYVQDVPEAERAARVWRTEDLAVIRPAPDDPDGEVIRCIRVTLSIPIHGCVEPFLWGVWITQSEASFDRYAAGAGTDQRGQTSSGWLPVSMAPYRAAGGPLDHLPCTAHWGPRGKRPAIVIGASDHPLAIDQRDGIDRDRAEAILTAALHP
jgi:hypothetical protein